MRVPNVMLALCSVFTTGISGAVEVSLPDVGQVTPGSEFQVNLTTTNLSGLAGYFFQVSFGPDLEALSVENAGLTASWGLPEVNIATSFVSAADFGSSTTSGSGTIARLRFRVKQSAINGQVIPLTLSQLQLNDGAIQATPNDGSVTVTRISVMYLAAGGFAATGTQLTVPLRLDDASGVTGYLVRLNYDPNVFELVGIQSGELPSLAGWSGLVVNQANGMATVSGFGAAALSGEGTLLNFELHIKSDAPTELESVLALSIGTLNDGQIGVVAEGASILIVDEDYLPLGLVPMVVLCLFFCLYMHSRGSAPARTAAAADHYERGE